jgi:hypothetical protein
MFRTRSAIAAELRLIGAPHLEPEAHFNRYGRALVRRLDFRKLSGLKSPFHLLYQILS